ncbi:alkaline phosphatase D family protein [Variovorax saccharolyticus]|uniref:alkaline phosphatase D family protein n=1 Tax=Variovorax saccharolyticus TaxID=3053516 RepID=UPI002577D90F|nr:MULTISPECIES: alkaline phosphatase D family protein [unclassified Variovorax]MDM0021716.1 alkaline phosphatase D family protein [Variovorax sp. J22R187]MDM0028029.1 alkaline phosphatase D family protein [Variovorax sp. J31P216]
MNLRRRELNRAALWLALGAWAVPLTGRAQPAGRWRADPFTLGVASGQPRPDGVVLWTRLAPDAEDLDRIAGTTCVVQYEIATDAALQRVVARGDIATDAARGFSVHVAAQGLQPQRDYWYRFRCGDAASAVGHTRTAPAPDADVRRLRLALASCQHYEQGFFAAHRDIAGRDLDFVLFVGDYIYEGSNPAYTLRQHGAPTPHTLAAYRERHALYKRDPDLQAAHAAHPWILTWDDHEVVNDYTGDREPAHDDAARFLRRRAAAYQAYFEHMPLAVPPQGAAMRIHERFAWGRLAELWTLDCRQHRSHHACPDPAHDAGRSVTGCAELADPARTMLGAGQERWLADGLAGAKRRWNLLGQSSQMSATGIDSPEGRRTWTDGWDGYPEARRRLLQGAVDAGVGNLVVLGGDVHRHVAADLRVRPNDPDSPVMASEFVGGSVTSRGAGAAAMARLRRDNPDVIHARGDRRGHALIELTPAALRCEFRTTAHPVPAEARFETEVRFEVEAGRAGVHPAG